MLSNYWMNKIMDTMYVNSDDDFYVGISSTLPNADGTNVTEPSGGNYSRKKVTAFNPAINGVITNADNITFNTSTDVWFSPSNKASYYVIFDGTDTSAHVLGSGAFYTPMEIGENVSLTIAAGLLGISILDAVAP